MAAILPTPLDYLQKYQQKEQIQAQFSEDIRHVIAGGYGKSIPTRGDSVGTRNTRGFRNHSPGIAAGAALTLGSTARASSEGPHSAARQFKERARGGVCPFDDHSAFQRQGPDEELRRQESSSREAGARSLTPSRRNEAYEAARSRGKQNRDQQTKIFSSAPFDAPERSMPSSSYAAASEAGAAGRSSGRTLLPSGRALPVGAPEQTHSYSASRQQAAGNRTRMAGADGLITGNYLLTEGKTAVPVGRSGKPPLAGGVLEPQAMLKAQIDGLGRPSDERAAFLNAKVASEACRARNNDSLLHFC